ncbi:MAG TPA: hypothetical protein VGP80_04005 [Gemmatimonadales bacterium]|nr:hypothetical protein [Gemmatimonadales bacterium]
MMTLRTILTTAGLMLGASLPALAQRIDSTSLAQLRTDRFVRIETSALGRIQGTVAQHSATDLTLANGGQHVIPVQEIQRAWVRGRHTKTGAIIGGILGAGGGIFLGLLAEGLCEYDCAHNAYIPLGLVGLGAGAGAGALIGMAFPRWKELH